mmetsp:Transcript_34449/g.75392  ORF Transcript_34449/g.75392 Transcript_34449/m.75392 type:complete len:424 (-) Transcript_34449:41-1312(-)|eukprot:CAMPEP_0178515874 /NCGR_PEP_ID=MMETSP0696-20121128/24794_1 /TAXON_ID=265572 /ORGANISM="Extubocellulus spinifer, Strain CCMP396" /LENGTH=423 /DNA_ID=CAMNT_0020146075 /DNA_START=176 /DNA_END=1447 /DNA_ORIENTATION=-
MKTPLRISSLRRSNKKKDNTNTRRSVVVNSLPPQKGVSLGVGTFSVTGDINFTPRTNTIPVPQRERWSETAPASASVSAIGGTVTSVSSSDSDSGTATSPASVSFVRESSTFMRMADLQVLADLSPKKAPPSSDSNSGGRHHYDHPSVEPPPGIERDPKERWVALDTGSGRDHAPVAPYAVDALAKGGLKSAMDQGMWKPNKQTERILRECKEWASSAWESSGPFVCPPSGFVHENSVLIWSGQFGHGLYGNELPTIRAAGLVNMSPRALVDLLVDSSRVNEYNKMSLGRSDVLVLHDSLAVDGPFGRSITKVVRSETQPPLVRKRLQFVTLIHARELEDRSGYIIVSRAVTRAEEPVDSTDGILRSEILMGVNVIRKVKGEKNRAVMINVNHIRSPMVPMFIAKKIGLSAAEGFFDDIRALC